MDHIAVLIPCYNEEKTIGRVVADTKRALPDAAIYVYNNNSTDRTAELAREAGAIVRNEYKQGKGNVIRRMFREIDAECYVMVDGDDTYPMDAAPELVDRVLNRNADMVVGDRLSSTYFTENKRPFHNFGNSLVRGCINRLFDCNVRDIMTGYRAFSYDFVKTFPGDRVPGPPGGVVLEAQHLLRWLPGSEDDCEPLPQLPADGVLRVPRGDPRSARCDLLHPGPPGLLCDRARAQVPDAHRLRVRHDGSTPFVFLRHDPLQHGPQCQEVL